MPDVRFFQNRTSGMPFTYVRESKELSAASEPNSVIHLRHNERLLPLRANLPLSGSRIGSAHARKGVGRRIAGFGSSCCASPQEDDFGLGMAGLSLRDCCLLGMRPEELHSLSSPSDTQMGLEKPNVVRERHRSATKRSGLISAVSRHTMCRTMPDRFI